MGGGPKKIGFFTAGIRILILMESTIGRTVGEKSTLRKLRLAEMLSQGWAWLVSKEPLQTSTQLEGLLFLQPHLPFEGAHAFAEQISEYTKSNFGTFNSSGPVDLALSAALHDAVRLAKSPNNDPMLVSYVNHPCK